MKQKTIPANCGEKYVADFRVYFKANGPIEPVHKGMLILNSLEKIQEFPE